MTSSFIKDVSISTYKQSSLIFFPINSTYNIQNHFMEKWFLFLKKKLFCGSYNHTKISPPGGTGSSFRTPDVFRPRTPSAAPCSPSGRFKNRTAAAAPGTASNFYLRGAASNGSHQKTKVLGSERKPGDTAGINNSIFCNVTAASQIPPWLHQERPPPPHLLHHSGSGSSCSHHPKKWPTT